MGCQTGSSSAAVKCNDQTLDTLFDKNKLQLTKQTGLDFALVLLLNHDLYSQCSMFLVHKI